MHCSLVQEITNSYNEFEDEDDVFYDEHRRQVFQLTAEEDDEFYANVRFPSLVDTRRKGLSSSPLLMPQCRSHYNWTENYATPPWLLSLWRTNGKGNGTGVFIPQNVKSSRRRNYRPRRKNNETGKTQKLEEKK
ncbi:Hypothetical predicted protein [Olea europaea subsp. europaea]|uniref:Uncharacterized protein n=1 Tax=Olea europaea subsp. europaea TaxID=158383 RepID=A0A8S0REB6_OLEEU|nr:Hypothetical predicted protein [Olea europaea subsp. europaea]